MSQYIRSRNKLRTQLQSLGERLESGDTSDLVVWVIPGELAVCHRPLRHHPDFNGSRRDLPAAATSAAIGWVDRIVYDGFRAIICLMHPKEVAHYAALELNAADLLAYYRSRGLQVCHIPWDDPAHRPAAENASFEDELTRVQSAALRCYEQLPKPVLLHCSGGIDRSSPVAAHILCECARNM